jgi:CheY-like chemotaxis protein
LTSRKSVVLVDDDMDIVTLLKNGLERNNYDVYAFVDPLKALEYLKSVKSPQLMITDLRMPGMTGFELIREVRKSHPDIGIIAMTAFEVNKSEFEKVLPSTKIDALINKPISIRKLIDAANAIYVSKR